MRWRGMRSARGERIEVLLVSMADAENASGREALRAYAAEGLGTAFLLAGVAGSGIMAENLANGNVALALLANAMATGALLPVLIHVCAPVSGAHFNPLVTIAEIWQRRLSASRAPGYLLAQVLGAMGGVFAAHAMFGLPILQLSGHVRAGWAQAFSESVATFGLLLLILRRFSLPSGQVPWLVGAYVASAYWFTASTSFANPAVTLARAFTDTFVGIRPKDVPAFILAQTLGAAGALLAHRLLGKNTQSLTE